MESKSCGVLDTPLEPVIGLAEGETRWLSMTVIVRSDATLNSASVIPGWRVSARPQMRNCASGNLEIPGSMLRIAPE
jgi:hypothetical protein